MRTNILTALKTRFAGVSETVLSRIADKMAKTVTTEDAVQAAVDAVTFQQIIDGEADRRATEATQSAVSNYEKKHSLKEGKPVSGDGQGTETGPDDKNKGAGGGTDDVPAWAKALIDSNKALAEKLAGIEKDKLAGSRHQQLELVIDKLPAVVKKPYEHIDLASMPLEIFEKFLKETTTEVETIKSDLDARGAVFKIPGSGGGNSGKEATKEEAEAIANDIL